MKRKELLIGGIVGLVLGCLYYWLLWDSLICDWFFGIELTREHWYFAVLALLCAFAFGINYGYQFGFGNRQTFDWFEIFCDLQYILLSVFYTTLSLALLALIIWFVTHPFVLVLLAIGFLLSLWPAAKCIVLIIIPG